MAALSFGISWLNNILGQKNFIKVPELARPLVLLGVVIVGTALVRGGIGMQVFGGGSWGGKSYFLPIMAIVGYFAFTAARVPAAKATGLGQWFFLSGSTAAVSNLVYVLGPGFYVLYLLFPAVFAISQASADLTGSGMDRIGGLAFTGSAIVNALLARYGFRGLLGWRKPWRMLIFLAAFGSIAFAGFRSTYVLVGLTLIPQFFLEGLHRTALLPIAAGLCLVIAVPLIAFSDRMPMSIQRAMCFLPVKVDPSVQADAQASVDWRVTMWKTLTPEIPQYLLIGKGYRIDPTLLLATDIDLQLGFTDPFETSRIAGDYHSGPLSVLISFGLPGVVAFLWFLVAGTKALYQNYTYGNPILRNLNIFLLAFFIARTIQFFFVYGDVRYDLYLFTGLVGLSVAINGGVLKKPVRIRNVAATAQFGAPQPA